MKDIYIIGAGGHSKVIIDILLKEIEYGKKIKIRGILDDSFDNSLKEIHNIPIVGKINICKELEGAHFIIAIGNNQVREKISKKYRLKYYTAIHPRAVVGSNVKIGEGTVIMANAVINSYTRLGNHVIVNTGTLIDHDCNIKDFTHLAPGVTLSGGVEIGRTTWIGVGCCIIQNLKIGKNTYIGAGSVIVKDVKDDVKAFGNPCMVRGRNE